MGPIHSEHGYNPSCGCYGVQVVRTESQFTSSASMEVQYDEFVDYEHTPHRVILPWNGAKLSLDYVERLLSLAKVPLSIQHDNAVSMIFRCVDEILTDPHRPDFASLLVTIVSDKDTVDYAAFFGEEDNDHDDFE